MIATFIIDWPVLAFMGLLFGAFANGAGRERWWKSRPFIAGTVSAATFTVVAMMSYVVAPDWMWMYYVEPSEMSATVPFIPLGYMFTFVLGFGTSVALAGRSAVLWMLGALALIFEGVAIAATWDRYHVVGTAAEWANGRADELFALSPDGDARTIATLGPVFLGVLAASLFVTWRSRAAAARR